ncbi:beta-phosphoglucomutase family hydrolase [Thermocatellispora tengchongensis]|uniref:Beta-phosphoglucomutase family hydrolase n=1 Tax=Thermocatellispora tengchongensis TaxID=1073253 RepID=A0A840P8N8_9ACTN|nr:HAD-IA family hydrolase [Thermocatellispora tengchongensis]MBB5134283.1 beta-phosphoglucomutase family hydrolase [Thermocatellispora tengchongensis]
MPAIDLSSISAVIFDTDGVVTDTARVHAAAWKHVFDSFLGGEGPPFDIREDYVRYVDGRSRHDGVRTFLASRGITLPEDAPDGRPSVRSLSQAKDALYAEQIDRYGVAPFPGTVMLLHELRRRGARTGVVSASRHGARVIRVAAVGPLFDALVDGNEAARLGLPGKPDPALFLEAARRLGVPPARAAVVEDTLPGVAAGRRGGFGLVIGLDRSGSGRQGPGLREAGADIVVADLDELTVTGRVPVTLR